MPDAVLGEIDLNSVNADDILKKELKETHKQTLQCIDGILKENESLKLHIDKKMEVYKIVPGEENMLIEKLRHDVRCYERDIYEFKLAIKLLKKDLEELKNARNSEAEQREKNARDVARVNEKQLRREHEEGLAEMAESQKRVMSGVTRDVMESEKTFMAMSGVLEESQKVTEALLLQVTDVLSASAGQYELLEKQVDTMGSQLREVYSSAGTAVQGTADETEMRLLRAQVRDLTFKNAQLSRTNEQLKSHHDSIQVAMQAKDDVISRLSAAAGDGSSVENLEPTDRRPSVSGEVVSSATLKALEAELQNEKTTSEGLRDQMEELKERHAKTIRDIETKFQELLDAGDVGEGEGGRDLKKENLRLQSQNIDLNETVMELRQQVADFRKSFERDAETRKVMGEQLKEAEDKYEKVRADHDGCRKKMQNLENFKKATQMANQTNVKLIAELQETIGDLKKSKNDAERSVAALKLDIEGMQNRAEGAGRGGPSPGPPPGNGAPQPPPKANLQQSSNSRFAEFVQLKRDMAKVMEENEQLKLELARR